MLYVRCVVKAVVLDAPGPVEQHPLCLSERPALHAASGRALLRVRACGLCRTDLHIVEGELPAVRTPLIPGHQIVGEVQGGASGLPIGTRVGVSWLGGTDGTCAYCARQQENLCDGPTFTGYTVDGGYAEQALAREDFVFPLPVAMDDLQAAPLLCAGVIGYRSLRVAGVERGERVGLFGFGASAHLALPVLRSWGCEVLRVHARGIAPTPGRGAGSRLGGSRDGPCTGGFGPGHHLRSEWRRGGRGAGESEKGRRCRDQRHPSRPDPTV